MLGLICTFFASVAFASVFLIGPTSAAEQHHLACIAQWGASCGGTDAFFNCGASKEVAAQVVCSIHTDRGVQRYPFTAKVIKTVGGGGCGLSTVDIVCHGLPDNSSPAWHYDNCQAGRTAMCPPNSRYFGCGTSQDQIAQSYCGGTGTPWQVFSYYGIGGGQCGKSLYTVACHMAPLN